MPRLVDHEERRRIVAEATWRVIERVGFEGTTLRAIADEIGFSTSVLAHYFRDKERLMEFAFQQGCRRVFEKIELESQHAPAGLPRLKIALERMMPDYLGYDAGAKATLNYWGVAASNPNLAAVHRENYVAWRGFLRRFLCEALELKQLPPETDIEMESSFLIAMIDGVLVGSVLESEHYSKAVQRSLLMIAIERLTGMSSKAGAGTTQQRSSTKKLARVAV